MRSSLFPRIDARNIDREVQPKQSSFSGKMEVAEPFLCSKLISWFTDPAGLLLGERSEPHTGVFNRDFA